MRILHSLIFLILLNCASQPKEAKIWTAEDVLSQLDHLDISLGDLPKTSAIRVSDQECKPDSSSFAFVVGGIKNLNKYLDYPIEARKKRIEGNVITRFTVEIDGKVGSIETLSNTNPLLNKSVKKMLKKTEFIPALCNSQLVPSSYTITNTFRVDF